MSEATIDYTARAKRALALLSEESSWFASNRADSEEEGFNSDEDLGGRFLLVTSDRDAEASTFMVFYKTVGTHDELAGEIEALLQNDMWVYAIFDLETQQKLEINSVTISFKEGDAVDLEA